MLKNDSEGVATDEDVNTGLVIYSALIYCHQMKLEIFLDNLLSTETLQSILKTLVNTIDSGRMETIVSEKMVSEFYHVLKSMFNLQYDGILLATASDAYLNLPYLLPYNKEMNMCRNESSCFSISNTINSLGKV